MLVVVGVVVGVVEGEDVTGAALGLDVTGAVLGLDVTGAALGLDVVQFDSQKGPPSSSLGVVMYVHPESTKISLLFS